MDLGLADEPAVPTTYSIISTAQCQLRALVREQYQILSPGAEQNAKQDIGPYAGYLRAKEKSYERRGNQKVVPPNEEVCPSGCLGWIAKLRYYPCDEFRGRPGYLYNRRGRGGCIIICDVSRTTHTDGRETNVHD